MRLTYLYQHILHRATHFYVFLLHSVLLILLEKYFVFYRTYYFNILAPHELWEDIAEDEGK